MRRANVELHIEELVLHGFDKVDRSQLGAAVQQQLAQLFEKYGVPPLLTAGSGQLSLDGGKFEMSTGTEIQAIAKRIAQNVYTGLSE